LQAVLFNDITGPNLIYSILFALPPLAVLSVEGLSLLWDRFGSRLRENLPAIVTVSLLAAAALAALSWAPDGLGFFGPADAQGPAHRTAFLYGGALLVLGLAFIAARRYAGNGAAGLVVIGLALAVSVVSGPFDYYANSVLTPRSAQAAGKELDRNDLAALAWLRDNTDPDDVVAVNDYSIDPGGLLTFNATYSAYSERRVFLEGWSFTARAFDSVGKPPTGAGPFADRELLNARALSGDQSALAEFASRYGVRWIVVDKLDGTVPVTPCLYARTRAAFSSPSMDVREIVPPRPGPPPKACAAVARP
jgi:hypothetical protein